ncbi:MAG: response regulator transcription factor [Cyanobacteriota bacterium]
MEKEISLLLVEDDENISSLLKQILSEKNFNVTHIDDGKKALECVKEHSFDLILLDEKLPSMYGSEVLVNIKASPKTCNIPVIMLTSLKDEEYQVSVLQEGADDYITKPFRINVLLARINTVLKRASSKAANLEIEVPDGSEPSSLSKKEIEVLGLVVKGYNNQKISETLYISESTVANHLKSIFSKLKADNRTQAAIIAIKLNLV